MLISAISKSQNVCFSHINFNLGKNNDVHNNKNIELMNNSLSEVIGRSQISFKAATKTPYELFNKRILQLINSNNKEKDINLNPDDITREEFSKGEISQRYTYTNSELGINIVSTTFRKGMTQIISKEQDLYKIELFDKKGRRVFLSEAEDETKTAMKNRTTVVFEYGDNPRQIYRRYKDGKISDIEVFDPKTKKNVYEGPLVETTYKDKSRWENTKNILTGQVVRRELRGLFGKLLHFEEFSPTTNELVHEIYRDKKAKTMVENYYSEDGMYLLSNEVKSYGGTTLRREDYSPETFLLTKLEEYDTDTGIRSISEYNDEQVVKYTEIRRERDRFDDLYKHIDTYEYDCDGNEIAHTRNEYRNGELKAINVYLPNSEKIKSRTYYETPDYYRVTHYNTGELKDRGNAAVSCQLFRDGKLICEDFYNPYVNIEKRIAFGEYSLFGHVSIYDYNYTHNYDVTVLADIVCTHYKENGIPHEKLTGEMLKNIKSHPEYGKKVEKHSFEWSIDKPEVKYRKDNYTDKGTESTSNTYNIKDFPIDYSTPCGCKFDELPF